LKADTCFQNLGPLPYVNACSSAQFTTFINESNFDEISPYSYSSCKLKLNKKKQIGIKGKKKNGFFCINSEIYLLNCWILPP